MNTSPVRYKRHRFPPQIIAHTVWLYFRFPLSLRLVEELLLGRRRLNWLVEIGGIVYLHD